MIEAKPEAIVALLDQADLVQGLGLREPPALISVVGGGGKSSLLFALAERLPGRTVLSATTRIFASQMRAAPEHWQMGDVPGWRERLVDSDATVLLAGELVGDRARGVPPDLPAQVLAHPRVDFVVVEADGSRTRPFKAPAEHEPVIPRATDLVVIVVGIDALERPIEAAAHRPERVCALTGLAPADRCTPEALARVVTAPQGGLRGVPAGARVRLLINKVEGAARRARALEVARHVLEARARIEGVLVGSLQAGPGARFERMVVGKRTSS